MLNYQRVYHPFLVPFPPPGLAVFFVPPGCIPDMRQRQPSRPTCTMSHSAVEGFKQDFLGFHMDFILEDGYDVVKGSLILFHFCLEMGIYLYIYNYIIIYIII